MGPGDDVQKEPGPRIFGKRGPQQLVTPKYVLRVTEEYVKRLSRNIRVQQVILVGSWAKGSYLEDSDVDLIVVSDDFRRMPLPDRLVFLQKHWRGRVPLEAFGYTRNEFQNLRKRSTYVKDTFRYGILLVPGGNQETAKALRMIQDGKWTVRRAAKFAGLTYRDVLERMRENDVDSGPSLSELVMDMGRSLDRSADHGRSAIPTEAGRLAIKTRRRSFQVSREIGRGQL